MRRAAVGVIVVVAVVSGLLLWGFNAPAAAHLKAPSTGLSVSLNPYPANRFHAPLSAMGLVGVTGAKPYLVSHPASAPSGTSGVSSITSNALRFINDKSYMPQSETSLALDPGTPSHILGSYNDARWFFCPAFAPSNCPSGYSISLSGFTTSSDGGVSVAKSGDLPGLNYTSITVPSGGFLVSWGDPAVAAGVSGNFYYASLAIDPFTGANGIQLSESNANLWNPAFACTTTLAAPWANHCWSATFVHGNLSRNASTFEDKELVAVDRNASSLYYGDVYIAWDHFNANGTSLTELARCTPALSCTMLAGPNHQHLNGADIFVAWSTPAVARNSDVYVSWCNFGTPTTVNPVNCSIARSTAGGAAFGSPNLVLSYMGHGTTLPGATVVNGYATEQFRTGDIPTLAVDTSGSSNNVYFAIAVCTQGSYLPGLLPGDPAGDCGMSNVAFTKSSNGGATWSTPVFVSNNAVNVQPWLSVDPTSGKVAVTYYSTQFDPFNHRIDVVSSVSKNFGATWSQVRVTSVSDEPDADPFYYDYTVANGFGGGFVVPQYGDYLGAVAWHGTLWVLYCAHYQAEQGTLQNDPFLAKATLP